MTRYLSQLLGVVALMFIAVYLIAPATGIYDYRAGEIRGDVVLMLVKAGAIGLGVGVGERLRRRWKETP